MTEESLANAKINISLDIVSKMANGYHNIRTIMQTVSLSDRITIRSDPGEGVSAEADLPFLPNDERNIAVKAAMAFFKHTGISGSRISISIKKGIPVCAGLGGGSADGACVLRMLDKMFGTGLGSETLETIGGTIGSDVPFCVSGGTSLAEGRGEILTTLRPIPQSHIVICKPPFSFSTPQLFSRVRCEKIRARPDTEGIIAALDQGDIIGIARRMYNVFEDVIPHGTRDISEIKNSLLDSGALGAVMTGSGPAVLGLFDNATKAQNAYELLKQGYKECYFAETTGRIA